jgi:hypothetical protein
MSLILGKLFGFSRMRPGLGPIPGQWPDWSCRVWESIRLCWKAPVAGRWHSGLDGSNYTLLPTKVGLWSSPATAIRIFDSWKHFKQASESCYKLERDRGIVLRCEIVRSAIHGRPQSPHRRTRGNSSLPPATRAMPSYQEDRYVIWSSQRLWREWPKTSRERNTDTRRHVHTALG